MATIQGVYLALFGRPADPAGLSFFNGITNNGQNLGAIGNLASQKEYQDRFVGQSNTQIVQSIYQSLFGREGEPSGVAFFVGELLAGRQTVNTIAINILDGARGNDLAVVNNKLAAANAFTAALDTPAEIASYGGNDAANLGRAFLVNVTSDPSTVPTPSQANAVIAQLPAAAPSNVLTTGIDNLVGTAGADIINGLINQITASTNTLTTGDVINGGAGLDTLALESVSRSSNDVVRPTISNVETITLSGFGGATLDFSSISGLSNFIYTTGQSFFPGGSSFNTLNAQNVSSNTLFEFRGDASNSEASNAKFTLAPGNTVLNIKLNAVSAKDVDLASLNPGIAASTVIIDSVGLKNFGPTTGGVVDNGINAIAAINGYAAGTSFIVTGSAPTSLDFFASGASFQLSAKALTGGLFVNGSKFADTISAGSGQTYVTGQAGVDIINLSTTSNTIDTVNLRALNSFADRDYVNGFNTGFFGVGGDQIDISAADTSANTLASSAPIIGNITSAPFVPTQYNLNNFDIIEFAFETTTGPLDNSFGASNLLTMLSVGGVAPTTAALAKGYFLAYADGNASIFYVQNDFNPSLTINEVQLVGVINGIGVGGLATGNFDLE